MVVTSIRCVELRGDRVERELLIHGVEVAGCYNSGEMAFLLGSHRTNRGYLRKR